MRIAIDISPLTTGHKYRGTGFYTAHLKNTFDKYFSKDHEFVYFTNKNQIPSDVNVIHYPYFDPFSFSVPLFSKIPVVVTVLDLIPIIFPTEFPAGIKGNLKWQRQKFALQHVAGIITDSLCAKKDIENIVAVKKEKVVTTYLAPGEEFKKIQVNKESLIKKYSLPDKFALYVGDATWNKNLPRLVRAAMQAKIPLVMAGRALTNQEYDKTNMWNKDLAEVQQLAKEHANIIRLGFIPDEDLVALYNAATVFIMPSLYEGFGLPVIEAMSCGTPVITTHEGSLREVAGNAAYIVDGYSEESIYTGLRKVFSDVSLQRKLSQAGIIQAKKFSWKKTAKETLGAYSMFTP